VITSRTPKASRDWLLDCGGIPVAALLEPHYRQVCGQVARLDPAPANDAELRLSEAARLYYTSAYPSEEAREFAQSRQLDHAQGFSIRVMESQPFRRQPDQEKFGIRQASIPDPLHPHLEHEVRQFRN